MQRSVFQLAGTVHLAPAGTTGVRCAAILDTYTCLIKPKEKTMRIGLNYITPLLAVGAAAAAIVVAPSAAAAATAPSNPAQAQQSCISLGGTQSKCQTPGNVQINDAPPQVDYFPYAGGAT
jgi:hypothetical protein